VSVAAGSGVVSEFADLSGSVFEQRTPPAGWTPATATDAELRFYGFPARPAAALERARWSATYANYSAPAPTGMCVNSHISHATKTKNWSGSVATGKTNYNYVEAHVKVPHDIFGCPHASGNSMWTGIGGTKILQNGVRDEGSTMNAWKWWYEAYSSSLDTGTIDVGGSVSPGQTMQFITNYFKDTNGKMTIEFFWYNTSNGTYNSVFTTTLKGQSVSYWYQGTQVEAITERYFNGATGKLADLRKWDSGNMLYTEAYVGFGTSASNLLLVSHTNYDMVGNNGTTPVATWLANGTSSSSFYTRHEAACE
jgi:hypothetical protein